MMSSQVDSFKAGAAAVKQRRFSEAVQHLEAYCRANVGVESQEHFQAQIWLVQTYKALGKRPEARHLCWILSQSEQPQVKAWATEMMNQLPVQIPGRPPVEAAPSRRPRPSSPPPQTPPPRQAHKVDDRQPADQKIPVKTLLATVELKGLSTHLTRVSGLTMVLLVGMVQALLWALFWLMDSAHPAQGLLMATGGAIAFNLAAFWVAPWVMDGAQRWIYGTRWTDLSEIERHSPEAARLIQQVCETQNLKHLKLGVIHDQNPTAFTYGSLPSHARLVVSQGLFTYLDEDEIAAVYAHELGHIVHWDFAVMTLATTLIQLTYLIHLYAQELGRNWDNGPVRAGLQGAATLALGCYGLGEALVLYLSRTREYHADRFAAAVTGNPNGLARALVKIAYGIVEEAKHSSSPHASSSSPRSGKVLRGLRALGIVDVHSAGSVGSAYQGAGSDRNCRLNDVFAWDLFSPWAGLVELRSSHPLTGKRIRALGRHAQQLDLRAVFDLSPVAQTGCQLDKKRLYRGFLTDVMLLASPLIGVAGGLLGGSLLGGLFSGGSGASPTMLLLGGGLLGFGVGTCVQGWVMFPSLKNTDRTDVLSLMSDVYASPLRGRPVQLAGRIVGRSQAGNRASADLQFQDDAGLVRLQYTSRLGRLGNLWFGWRQAAQAIGTDAWVTGWFRRGLSAQVDLYSLERDRQTSLKGYPRFSQWLRGSLCTGLGGLLVLLALGSRMGG